MTARDGTKPADPDPVAIRRARVLRPWRIALVVYGVALTVATHWPRLVLGPEIPTSDKMIHLLVFGLLTVLLWRSGWFGPRWLVAIVAITWAAIDETTQGIPILHRTVTWYDMIANICGVACAMSLIWAMQPLQPREQIAGPDRARSQLFEYTFDEMFAHRLPWLIGAALATVVAGVILLLRPLMSSPRSVGIMGLIVVIAAVHVLYLAYRRIFFARLRRVQRERPCLACGASVEAAHVGAGGFRACVQCGERRDDVQYTLGPRPSLRAILRVSLAPALVAMLGVAALFAAVLVLPHVYGWAIASPSGRSTLPRIAQIFGRMPRELSSVVDLTVYMLLIAVVVRMWRRRMAAFVDRAVRCFNCGHDLHGTPVNERGEGHCGECGAAFVRQSNDES